MADPAQSTLPTSFVTIEDIQRFMQQLNGKPPVNENVKTIKDFCALLRTFGSPIITILAEYDGSGDSGDMDVSAKIPAPQNVAPGNTVINGVQNTNNYVYRRFRQAFDDELKDPDMEKIGLTATRLDEVEDAMFSLLPGGWEINDGSFGEITIDVQTGEIEVTHNERYTEVNTSTQNY